eukprot:g6442.t1
MSCSPVPADQVDPVPADQVEAVLKSGSPERAPAPTQRGPRLRRWSRWALCCLLALGVAVAVAYGVWHATYDWGPDSYVPPASLSQQGRALFVTPAELAALRDNGTGAVVLDARTETDGLVPGAAHAPWKLFARGGGTIARAEYGGAAAAAGQTREQREQLVPTGLLLGAPALEAALRRLGVRDGRPIVVYGGWHRVTYKLSFAPRTWGEEGRLYWMLRYLNASDVRCLYGGINAWRKDGRPLASGAEAARGAAAAAAVAAAAGTGFVARPVPALRATAAGLRGAGAGASAAGARNAG